MSADALTVSETSFYFKDFFGLHNTPFPSRPFHSLLFLILLGGLGSAVSSPSGVWDGAPAEFYILVHLALKSDVWWQQF